MEAYNVGRATGLVFGIIVGLVICVFVFRYMNKDKKVVTKYDERQELARGRAYKYGFWASMAAAVVVMFLEMIQLTVATSFTKYFFIMFVGIMVQVGYSIWNDAYYGINTNKSRLTVVCLIAGLCNLVGVIGSIAGKQFIVDGVVTDSGANALCCIMMIYAAVMLFVKSRKDKRGGSIEESED